MMTEQPKFDASTKKTGFAHLIAATRYSSAGFLVLLKEAAFRQELTFAAIALVLYVLIGVSAQSIVIALCLIMITLAIEAVNTAIELVIDKTSPEISEYAKNAKDLGSLAVMCLLISNGVFGAYAIWSTLS
ncbi:MAG: diacylglycerol kinase [Salaquimonas sp.]